MNIYCPSLSLLKSFVLQYILSDIKNGFNDLLLGSICLEVLFASVYLKVISILDGEMSFLDATEIWTLFSNSM